jgi:hypothetical protein
VGKTAWRTEPTTVEKVGDDLWLGVKGQSNSVIAGSPRNAFGCSVVWFLPEVEHWMVEGPYQVTDISQTPNAGKCSAAVRRRGISFVVERETAQTAS